MHKFKRRLLVPIVFLVFPVLLIACTQMAFGGNAQGISSGAVPQTSTTVALTHQPVGTAVLSWNPNDSTLTVTLHMSGLTPSSSHPAHIHRSDSCQAGGPMLFALHPVVADAVGVGTSKTEIKGMTNGIPRQGWIINVHNGPGLTPEAQFLPIACVTIHNHSRIHGLLVLRYTLDPTTAANQNASGQAWLSVANHQLMVKVVVRGFVPGSVHREHIHLGTCVHQGKVLYMLNTLVAGRDGTAMTTTVINNIARIPAHGWRHLNVHRSALLTNQNGTMNTTNFDPISCGNIG